MKKFCCLLISFILCFSSTCLVSCQVQEVNPENLKTPELNSLITYTISDTERISLLYTQDQIYGEWYKNGEVKRVVAFGCPEYWGFLFSREGMSDFYYEILEIDGFEIFGTTNINKDFVYGPERFPSTQETLAFINAGLLNSTSIKLTGTNATLPITNITVAPSDFEQWDWWSEIEGWAEFCSYDESTIYKIDALNLTYSPYRNVGEWKVGETMIPIKIKFYDDIKAIEVYDISNYGSKLTFVANVEFNAVGDAVFKSAYGNLYNDGINIDNISNVVLSKI